MCSSICFFPDRITKWCCEIRRVLRQVPRRFFCSFSQASPPLHLFYSFILVVPLLSIWCILLCHVSYSTVTHMSRVKYPLPIAIVCCLSLASCSACSGICCYLYIYWVVGKLFYLLYLLLEIIITHLHVNNKTNKQRHRWVSCILVLTTAHLCPLNILGPEFLLSVPRLSALTTRGYAYWAAPRPLPESTALSSGHN